MTEIRVKDGDQAFSFAFEDLVKFHGTKSICGLTVSLKIMEAAWEAGWSGEPPERGNILVQSGFPGPGTRDGFELVTRATSRDAYEILGDPPTGPLIGQAAKGSYFFRVSDGKKSVEVALKQEVIPEGFVVKRRNLQSGLATDEDKAVFRKLQFAFSDRLRAFKPSEAVNVLSVMGLK
jgi:hypothetical protein